MEDNSPAPAASQFSQPSVKKSGGFFAFLGKIFIFLLLAGGLLFGGYYFGTKATNDIARQAAPTPTVTAVVSPTAIPPSPTAASQQTKTVKAGLADSTA